MAKKAVIKVVEGKTDEAIIGFLRSLLEKRSGGGDCYTQDSFLHRMDSYKH